VPLQKKLQLDQAPGEPSSRHGAGLCCRFPRVTCADGGVAGGEGHHRKGDGGHEVRAAVLLEQLLRLLRPARRGGAVVFGCHHLGEGGRRGRERGFGRAGARGGGVGRPRGRAEGRGWCASLQGRGARCNTDGACGRHLRECPACAMQCHHGTPHAPPLRPCRAPALPPTAAPHHHRRRASPCLRPNWLPGRCAARAAHSWRGAPLRALRLPPRMHTLKSPASRPYFSVVSSASLLVTRGCGARVEGADVYSGTSSGAAMRWRGTGGRPRLLWGPTPHDRCRAGRRGWQS
jgi:hypothetical protein